MPVVIVGISFQSPRYYKHTLLALKDKRQKDVLIPVFLFVRKQQKPKLQL